MNTNNIIRWVKPFTSLKLTVLCLGCAMILVFVATLDQVNIGVYEAENRYFKSFFLYFIPPGTTLKIPWFPGGYLVGGLLLLNLIAAHLARFRFSSKKAGILVLHSGVILLLLGQLFTSLFQVESQIRLNPGESKNYSVSYYHDELAFIASQLVVMGLGLIPQRYWRGVRTRAAKVPAKPATVSVPLRAT